MTSDQAREIAIRVLRGERFAYTDPFLLTDAAAVLEALGPLGSIALPGVAPRTQGEPQANPRCDSCGCETRRRCEACGKVQSGEPQANVEEKKAALDAAVTRLVTAKASPGIIPTAEDMQTLRERLRDVRIAHEAIHGRIVEASRESAT